MDERDPETYALIGAGMAVHRELGCGFLEPVYQAAFAIELGMRDIPFMREVNFPILYRGETLTARYRADYVCFDRVLIEVKALSRLSSTEDAQAINYLKASKLRVALLLNFGSTRLEYKRLVL